MARRAVLTVVSGPNNGDSLTVDSGYCRLVGRHLSDAETAMIDRDGNRLLDSAAADILTKHLKDKAPATGASASETFSATSFERGADIIFADDSISRAHAMVFYDETGIGIIDLASTNGTFVNSERVNSAMIGNGDSIAIGNSDINVSTETL